MSDFVVTERLSLKAKTLQLQVTSAGQIVLVYPKGVSKARSQAFLQEHHGWIAKHAASLSARRASFPFWHPDVQQQASLCTILGSQQHVLIQTNQSSKRQFTVNWDRRSQRIFVHCANDLALATRQKLFMAWVSQLALGLVRSIVGNEAPKVARWPAHVALKLYKQKWGLLDASDQIFINRNLIFAPIDVLRYVVIHELCHLRVRSHNSQFYRHVAAIMPDYQRQEKWLREYGFILQSTR